MLTPFSLLCDAGSGSHLFEPCRVLTLFAVVDTWEIHGREVTSLSCTKCSSACTVCGVRGSWDVDPPPPSQLLPAPGSSLLILLAPPPCSRPPPYSSLLLAPASSMLQASSLLLPPPPPCSRLLLNIPPRPLIPFFPNGQYGCNVGGEMPKGQLFIPYGLSIVFIPNGGVKDIVSGMCERRCLKASCSFRTGCQLCSF